MRCGRAGCVFGASPACGEGLQPVACLIDRLGGDGEGQSQVALAGRTEGRAGNRGEVVLLQQLGRQIPGVQSPVLDVDEGVEGRLGAEDRKSTRLNSSHVAISYAVFCLKKKTTQLR